jgi:hypothetical protein
MNTPTLTASLAEAQAKAINYRAAARRQPNNAEYQAAAEVYELLAEGRTLIDVGVAIRGGGFDHQDRPRLALARADRQQVYFEWRKGSDTGVFDSRSSRHRNSWHNSHQQLVERVNFNRVPIASDNYRVWGFALVPMVPPEAIDAAREKAIGSLRDWHVLWEVEQWSHKPLLAEPPVDPYLVRRVRGDLFEVLAEWDLTEIERMVMAGRARL